MIYIYTVLLEGGERGATYISTDRDELSWHREETKKKGYEVSQIKEYMRTVVRLPR